jgi:hypothetical protein
MTVTVSIAAEAAAEPAKQKDHKDNYENKSQRHGFHLRLLYLNEKLPLYGNVGFADIVLSMPSTPAFASWLTATDNTPRIDL